jgi:hypothetical protein
MSDASALTRDRVVYTMLMMVLIYNCVLGATAHYDLHTTAGLIEVIVGRGQQHIRDIRCHCSVFVYNLIRLKTISGNSFMKATRTHTDLCVIW